MDERDRQGMSIPRWMRLVGADRGLDFGLINVEIRVDVLHVVVFFERFDQPQRPAFGERVVKAAINRQLVAQHARDHVAKERRVGWSIGVALDLSPDPVGLEFGEEIVEALRSAMSLKPERHEFNEKPEKILRIMAATGG